MTLTLIRQCSISTSSELFSYATMYSNFMFLDRFLLSYRAKTYTHCTVKGLEDTWLRSRSHFSSTNLCCLETEIILIILLKAKFKVHKLRHIIFYDTENIKTHHERKQIRSVA